MGDAMLTSKIKHGYQILNISCLVGIAILGIGLSATPLYVKKIW
jgi:hypothetical protein